MADITGRIGKETGSEGLRSLWKTADELNEGNKGKMAGEFVPWRAIEIREVILPRDTLDEHAVEVYAARFDETPPIKVQRGTFVLIAGRHRLQAVVKASRDHIRIVEVDVPDDQLWIEAFKDNDYNGVPMSGPMRVAAAKKYADMYPDKSDGEVADWAVVSRETVWRHRQATRHPEKPTPTKAGMVKPGKKEEPPKPFQAVPKPGQAAVTQNVTKKVTFEFNFKVPDESPALIAEDTPTEQIDAKIDLAKATLAWFSDYLIGLESKKMALDPVGASV